MSAKCEFCGVGAANMELHQEVAHSRELTAKEEAAEAAQLAAKAQAKAAKEAAFANRSADAVNPVLVVYEQVGEDVKVYQFKATSGEVAMLKKCHNEIIESAYDLEDDEHLVEMVNLLQNFTPVYEVGNNVAPAFEVNGNLTVICTGQNPGFDAIAALEDLNSDSDEDSDEDSDDDSDDSDDEGDYEDEDSDEDE